MSSKRSLLVKGGLFTIRLKKLADLQRRDFAFYNLAYQGNFALKNG